MAGMSTNTPAAVLAMEFLTSIRNRLGAYIDIFSMGAMSGDALAGDCLRSIRKFLSNQQMSELEVLGLAWVIRNTEDPWFKYVKSRGRQLALAPPKEEPCVVKKPRTSRDVSGTR